MAEKSEVTKKQPKVYISVVDNFYMKPTVKHSNRYTLKRLSFIVEITKMNEDVDSKHYKAEKENEAEFIENPINASINDLFISERYDKFKLINLAKPFSKIDTLEPFIDVKLTKHQVDGVIPLITHALYGDFKKVQVDYKIEDDVNLAITSSRLSLKSTLEDHVSYSLLLLDFTETIIDKSLQAGIFDSPDENRCLEKEDFVVVGMIGEPEMVTVNVLVNDKLENAKLKEDAFQVLRKSDCSIHPLYGNTAVQCHHENEEVVNFSSVNKIASFIDKLSENYNLNNSFLLDCIETNTTDNASDNVLAEKNVEIELIDFVFVNIMDETEFMRSIVPMNEKLESTEFDTESFELLPCTLSLQTPIINEGILHNHDLDGDILDSYNDGKIIDLKRFVAIEELTVFKQNIDYENLKVLAPENNKSRYKSFGEVIVIKDENLIQLPNRNIKSFRINPPITVQVSNEVWSEHDTSNFTLNTATSEDITPPVNETTVGCPDGFQIESVNSSVELFNDRRCTINLKHFIEKVVDERGAVFEQRIIKEVITKCTGVHDISSNNCLTPVEEKSDKMESLQIVREECIVGQISEKPVELEIQEIEELLPEEYLNATDFNTSIKSSMEIESYVGIIETVTQMPNSEAFEEVSNGAQFQSKEIFDHCVLECLNEKEILISQTVKDFGHDILVPILVDNKIIRTLEENNAAKQTIENMDNVEPAQAIEIIEEVGMTMYHINGVMKTDSRTQQPIFQQNNSVYIDIQKSLDWDNLERVTLMLWNKSAIEPMNENGLFIDQDRIRKAQDKCIPNIYLIAPNLTNSLNKPTKKIDLIEPCSYEEMDYYHLDNLDITDLDVKGSCSSTSSDDSAQDFFDLQKESVDEIVKRFEFYSKEILNNNFKEALDIETWILQGKYLPPKRLQRKKEKLGIYYYGEIFKRDSLTTAQLTKGQLRQICCALLKSIHIIECEINMNKINKNKEAKTLCDKSTQTCSQTIDIIQHDVAFIHTWEIE